MNQKTIDIRHELLSEIHKLLSFASADDFMAASKLCKSDNIKLALEALAEEHRHVDKRQPSISKAPPLKQPTSKKEVASKNQKGGYPGVDSLKDLLLLNFSNRPRTDLLQFAKLNKLTFNPNTKDSTIRLIPSLAKQLTKLSKSELDRILKALQLNLDSQTTGWMQVIRNRD